MYKILIKYKILNHKRQELTDVMISTNLTQTYHFYFVIKQLKAKSFDIFQSYFSVKLS